MIELNPILHFIAACFCTGPVVFAILRERRNFVGGVFALGMCALALESFFTGLSARAIFPEQAIRWQLWSLTAAALLPGIWLLFGLSFAQEDFRPLQTGWKWVVLIIFMLHLVFVSLLRASIFEGAPIELADGWAFALGWAGYGFYVFFLLSLVFIMIILERILKASRGRKRWQIKFFVFGIGGLFAVRIYTISQALVFHTLNLELEVINAVALVIANFLILISMLRSSTLKIDIYVSQKMLYNSLTLIVVGLYFLALGISVHIFDPFLSLPLRALIVFLALLGLLIVLFSNRVRLKMKRLVSRHFRRPQYDYRKVWTDFATRTTALVEEKALCEAVVKMISEMFDFFGVSIWLSGATHNQLRCGASTALPAARACNLSELQNEAPEIMRRLNNPTRMLDLWDPQITGSAGLTHAQMDLLRKARIRYVFPLEACGDLMGFISLGDRVKNQPLSFEEREMLQTITDQVAANFLNLKLSERLGQAKKMEAFQTIATFFVHDLKNLAAKLSMMLKNLPAHFADPAFRDDALRLVSQSVDQVEGLCSRLSTLREKLEIRPVQTDLSAVVAATLAIGNDLPSGSLVKDLQPVPRVYADPEQIQRVLTNLILNASDAVGNDGEICVTTGTRDGWVVLAVRDTGCGISKEFMDQCLFKPFKTTKRQGTGIGLFQSKVIVEAHNGMMEVESQEGQGSTFRVLLPVIQY